MAGGGTGSKYNSDSWGSITPIFTDMAQWKLDEATGTCGIGSYCLGSPPSAGTDSACKNTNPGGGGGAVDDPDCEYDYEFRDSFNPGASTPPHLLAPLGGVPPSPPPHSGVPPLPPSAGGSKFFPSQACWDFCTNYVHDADTSAKRCGVRNALYKGGEIHCGFIGGKYLSHRSRGDRVDGHHARCHMFASSGHIETIGGEQGAFQFGNFKYGVAPSPYLNPSATHNSGPYDAFVMVRRSNPPHTGLVRSLPTFLLTRLLRPLLTYLLLALSCTDGEPVHGHRPRTVRDFTGGPVHQLDDEHHRGTRRLLRAQLRLGRLRSGGLRHEQHRQRGGTRDLVRSRRPEQRDLPSGAAYPTAAPAA